MPKDDLPNPHDRLFREVWSDRAVAVDFLSHYLPSNVLARVDLSSIRISKDSFVESDLRAHYADMLYELSLSGLPGFIYLLFEHKSNPERWVHLQLLGYLRNIWRLHLKQQGGSGRRLPVIVTMLLYHGRRPWSGPSRLIDLMEPTARDLSAHVPDFEFILCDLSRFSDHEIRGVVLTRATLLLMKHIFDPDIRHKLPKLLALMRDLYQTEDGLSSIYTLMRYIMGVLDDISIDEMQGMMDEALPETEEKVIMTLAERLRREGFEKGKQEGMKQEIQQGEQMMKHILGTDIRHELPKMPALMRDLYQTEDGLSSIYTLMRYIMGVLDDISIDEMQGMMDEALPETEEKVIMTLAEQLRQEGFKKGKQEGVKQGVKQGEQKGTFKGLRQGLIEAIELGLTLRFGDKAIDLMPKVRRMRKIEKLQALKEAIKTANDLSDFKGRM